MSADERINKLDGTFLDEYTSPDAILKYTRATAGFGIGYLLDHDYRDVYFGALEELPDSLRSRGIRLLEFGCGGGMNLVHLTRELKRAGVKVSRAVGTDFSPVLIDAATREANHYLREEDRSVLQFYVARNERLIADLESASGLDRAAWTGAFEFILGVNTVRYCHRGQRESECARDIRDLLAPGGICVVIDMNDRFPAFRSALRSRFRRVEEDECYLPSLAEYAQPFELAGFEVLRKAHFCWVPHSAGRLTCLLMRGMSPVLNALVPSRAMRSLLVLRKPNSTDGLGLTR